MDGPIYIVIFKYKKINKIMYEFVDIVYSCTDDSTL